MIKLLALLTLISSLSHATVEQRIVKANIAGIPDCETAPKGERCVNEEGRIQRDRGLESCESTMPNQDCIDEQGFTLRGVK